MERKSQSTGSRRRRALLAFAAVGVASLGLTSCAAPADGGGGGGGGDETFTIYWHPGHAYPEYEEVINEFGEEHDLEINWQKFQWPDMATKLVGDFRSGNVPDLVEEGTYSSIQHGEQGNLLALDEFIEQDGEEMGFPEDFQEAAVGMRQYDGSTWALPLHLTANGLLFYNKTILAEAGYDEPPATWDEFLEVARATTKDGVHGFALNGRYAYADAFLAQQGVPYPTDIENDVFMEPADDAEKAYGFLQNLITEGLSPAPTASTDISGPQKLFSAGRAAMFISGPWDILPVTEGSGDIDWAIAPPLTGKVQASAVAGTGLMIPAKAKHPELAWELMKRLTALEVELAVTESTGMTMPRKSWAESPEITGDPLLAPVAESLTVAVMPDIALAASGKQSEVFELNRVAYEKIVIQGANVSEALERFRSQARELFE